MAFICEQCNEPIHGVGAVHDNKIIHHRCKTNYENSKIEKIEETVE